MNHNHILKSCIFIFSCAVLIAAEDATVSEPTSYGGKIGIGFSAGPTSGMGFAFRKHFENRLGMNIAAIVLGGKDEYSTWVWANLGGQVMYTIHQNQKKVFRLYSLLGASMLIQGDNNNYYGYEYYYPDTTYHAPDNSFKYDNIYTIGAGLGMEFVIAQRISISLDVPLSVSMRKAGFNIWPIPNVALVYYLK